MLRHVDSFLFVTEIEIQINNIYEIYSMMAVKYKEAEDRLAIMRNDTSNEKKNN